MIKVALMGHGVVGSGVAEILEEKASSLCQKAGDDLYCAKILDLRDFPDHRFMQTGLPRILRISLQTILFKLS